MMLEKLELLLPPLPLTFVFALVMLAIDVTLPIGINFTGQTLLASFLLILGLLFILPAAISFFKANTTVDPRTPAKSNTLVISGLYKISRNPMYVGMLLCLISLSFAQGNIINVFIAMSFAVYITRFQIKPEERFLSEKFGEQYQQYCEKVGRWI